MMRPERRFAFRLALALGLWDVDAMLAAMPRDLLIEWRAFALVEPFGHPAEDRRHAEAMMARSHGKVGVEQWRYKPPFKLPIRRKTLKEIFGCGPDDDASHN